jgi:hypothetical protein
VPTVNGHWTFSFFPALVGTFFPTGVGGDVREVAMVALSTFAPSRALDLRARRWLPTWRTTPFAFVYVALLTVGSIVLSLLDTGDHDAVLKVSSTDVDHLSTHPIFVLVTSALWVDGIVDCLLAVLVLGIVATVLERRVGTRWVVAIFASGHVGATLLTEGSVAVGVHYGVLPATAASRLDVGVSYGLAAMLGAAAGLLPRPVRTMGVLGGWAYLGWPIASGLDMTSWGHIIALGIGVSWWPWLRHGELRERNAFGEVRERNAFGEVRERDAVGMMEQWSMPRSPVRSWLLRQRLTIPTSPAASSFFSTTTMKALSEWSSTDPVTSRPVTQFRFRGCRDGPTSSVNPQLCTSVDLSHRTPLCALGGSDVMARAAPGPPRREHCPVGPRSPE